MARYLKLYKDAKLRQRHKGKVSRKNEIRAYFSKCFKHQTVGGGHKAYKNFCQITGSARSYYKQFSISRHSFRKNAAFGLLPGVRKSSW